jgi:hypothetical protein
MPKKTENTNPRVVVTPKEPWIMVPTFEDQRKACAEIEADIRRHVDGFESVSFEYDKKHSCEYCGSPWTENSAVYNGGCCDEDEKNNPDLALVTPTPAAE